MYLAIDTTSEIASLALIREDQILAELTWRCGQNHTVELLPRLSQLLNQSGIDLKAIKGIIVAKGPGSFNGLRVGLGTAKGLAFSLEVPIVGISTLEAAAHAYKDSGLPVCAILNAGRNEVAYASYQFKDGRWQTLVTDSITTLDELCSRITSLTIFCGELTSAMMEQIQARLGDKAIIPSPASMLRRAGFLAEMGAQRLKAGIEDDPATLQPTYLRRPQITQPRARNTTLQLIPGHNRRAGISDMARDHRQKPDNNKPN